MEEEIVKKLEELTSKYMADEITAHEYTTEFYDIFIPYINGGVGNDNVQIAVRNMPVDMMQKINAIIGNLQEPTKNNLGVDCIDREQAIEGVWKIELVGIDNKKIVDMLKDLPSVTPQEPRWIPVSERLPEERLGVLVWCPTRKNIYCACYEEKQWWIFGAYWEKVTEEIVAWMPLPKPYEPQESEDT